MITVSGGGKTETISVSVTESSLALGRQATTATSLIFLVVALLAIGASILLSVRCRETRRQLEEMREGGRGSGYTVFPIFQFVALARYPGDVAWGAHALVSVLSISHSSGRRLDHRWPESIRRRPNPGSRTRI